MDPLQIKVQEVQKSGLSSIDFSNLGFGNYMCDHMFQASYSNGSWHSAALKPFGPLQVMPTMLALHYGQSVFEGMKAFRMEDDNISVFRIRKHYDRLCRSLDRMCMPQIPFEYFEQGIIALIRQDHAFVPKGREDSLYIRPLLFATEAKFGVKISEEYLFIVMAGPVGPFYSNALKVKVEDKYIRAAPGGTGSAKCAGNYGGAFYATKLAREQGFDQVLWTDRSAELNIEESGTMNVFFRIGDKLVTPPLSDTILEGITRDSVITIAKSFGITVEERTISAQEIADAANNGTLKEAFGAGTAAITASIAMIGIRDQKINLPAPDASTLSTRIHEELLAIRSGRKPDVHEWNTVVRVRVEA